MWIVNVYNSVSIVVFFVVIYILKSPIYILQSVGIW